MELLETGIAGCYEIRARVLRDVRGTFTKTFHAPLFKEMGLCTDWKEEYYSVSGKGVVRGMHFQVPPAEHTKLVSCLRGEVLDVVVDLRLRSPTYLQCRSYRISPEKGNSLYIPPGLAHGFLALTEGAIMNYKVTSVYDAGGDRGVLWSSLDFDWPEKTPVVSARDMQHPSVQDFISPFVDPI